MPGEVLLTGQRGFRCSKPRPTRCSIELRHVDPYEGRGRFYLAFCWFSATSLGGWLAAHVAWPLDPLLLRITRGRFSTSWPIATAVLETRGARTGLRRRHATIYFHDGERVILVPAYRGNPRDPAWFHNLRKHPDVVFGGRPYRAEVVDDEAERERLWELADRVYPQFADFRARAAEAGRVIPIVRLVAR